MLNIDQLFPGPCDHGDDRVVIVDLLDHRGDYLDFFPDQHGFFRGGMMFDFVAKAKYQAWEECQGLTSDDAMQQYVDLIVKLEG